MLLRLRNRIVSWAGRKYLARVQRGGLDLANLSLLPDSALMPLHRDGLDPVPALGELRRSDPVTKLPLPFGITVWLVTGDAAVREVLGSTADYSNDFNNLVGNVGITADSNPGGLGFADPPEHTRLRKLLTPEFTMRRLRRLTPRIQEIVDNQLDEMERAAQDGPVDMVHHFALPIPSLTICELLGVPYADRAEFQRLSTARFDLFGGATSAVGAITESLSYLQHIVEGQRRSPGDGLLGMLIREHGDQIDDQELAGLADGVLTGGLETTASMLTLGTVALLRDERARGLCLGTDEEVNAFVEELLRYLTVVQVAFPRFAKKDHELAGVHIAKGDTVVCSLSAANRDEGLGTDLERFDPSRKPGPHLAFGYGAHRCVGAELGRMELRTAYPALIKRFPNLRLAVTESDLSYRKASIVYGLESLLVRLD